MASRRVATFLLLNSDLGIFINIQKQLPLAKQITNRKIQSEGQMIMRSFKISFIVSLHLWCHFQQACLTSALIAWMADSTICTQLLTRVRRWRVIVVSLCVCVCVCVSVCLSVCYFVIIQFHLHLFKSVLCWTFLHLKDLWCICEDLKLTAKLSLAWQVFSPPSWSSCHCVCAVKHLMLIFYDQKFFDEQWRASIGHFTWYVVCKSCNNRKHCMCVCVCLSVCLLPQNVEVTENNVETWCNFRERSAL